MVIVDTTVWVDYLRSTRNSETEWLDRQADQQRLGLTDLMLCEVLEGERSDPQFNRVRAELLKFQPFETDEEQLAIAAARNFRRISERGRTVRETIDCSIATFCLAHAHTLLHRDHHFDAFEQYLGLAVLHP